MRRLWPLLMAALVFLFLAEGQRAFFASILAAAHDALLPSLRPAAVVLAAAPLLLVLAPLLPLARGLDRRTAVATAAIAVALFRLVVMAPALPARLIGGGLVLASTALFVTWGVGLLDRRSLAGGLVVGLTLDQLLRLAGASYDLSLQPIWLPVQLVLSLALAAGVVLWARSSRSATDQEGGAETRAGDDREQGLERRAGGLRLRGALALGALLFMDLHVLGLPPVVAQWTGTAYPAAGMAVGVAGAAAVAVTLLLGRPSRGRPVTLLLVAIVTAGALTGYWASGELVAALMAAAHFAALLLMTRALEPASGRRSGSTVAAGFALFALTTTAFGLAFFPPSAAPLSAGAVPWIFIATGLVLAACFVLLPRPETIPPPPSALPAVALALLLAVAAGVLSLTVRAPAAVTVAGTGGTGASTRVASWTARYGFDEAWRFDPGAVASIVTALDGDVVALREAPVGTPLSYGIDLPLWIGRSARLRPHASPGVAGIDAAALLTRLGGRFESPAPAGDESGQRRLLLLRTALADVTVTFALPQLAADRAATASRLRAALDTMGARPVALLGVGPIPSDGPVAAALARAGFHNAFDDTADSRPGTAASHAAAAGDGIWIRGLRAETATFGPDRHGGPRPLIATLHIHDVRIRSSDTNDLQTP